MEEDVAGGTQPEYLYRPDGMRLQSLKKVAGNQDERTEEGFQVFY